jgi:choice-of-anchor B domain-containing protein
MKKNYILLILIFIASQRMFAQTYSASNFTLISQLDPEPSANTSGDKYSACWGWTQVNKNKEYAIACSQSGTYWIDITNPSTPTVSAYRAGALSNCTWRETKTYQNFCYVISDDGGANRFQIFDMQYLPDSVHKVHDKDSIFERGHALWIDGSKMYIASVTSTNNSFASLVVYSLANPALPLKLRELDQDYSFINHVHDSYVRKDTIFASCGNQGLYVYTLTPANHFSQVGSLTSYANSGYNHSSALTPNGQTLVFMDEVPTGLPIKVANASNVSNIQVLATINQFPQTTPHNPFIVNNQYCFVSSYQDGTQLFDISNPSSPFLAGYFDTYPQAGGNNNTWPTNNGYEGQWGCYPFFPSKTIFALDQKNGIFLLKTALYQNPAVTAGYTVPASSCVNSTIQITNTSSGATNYSWTAIGGTISNSTLTNVTVNFTSAGIKTITLLASNPSNSAVLTQTIFVAANTLVAPISSTNSACSTCSTGIIKVSVSGGTAPYTYSWSPGGATTSSLTNRTPGCYTVTIKDANTCVTKTNTCISFFTDLKDISELDSKLKIYPNPAQSFFNLEFPHTPFSYTVYTKLGEIVSQGKSYTSSLKVDLTDFVKGLYLLELKSGDEKISRKIIVE